MSNQLAHCVPGAQNVIELVRLFRSLIRVANQLLQVVTRKLVLSLACQVSDLAREIEAPMSLEHRSLLEQPSLFPKMTSMVVMMKLRLIERNRRNILRIMEMSKGTVAVLIA